MAEQDSAKEHTSEEKIAAKIEAEKELLKSMTPEEQGLLIFHR